MVLVVCDVVTPGRHATELKTTFGQPANLIGSPFTPRKTNAILTFTVILLAEDGFDLGADEAAHELAAKSAHQLLLCILVAFGVPD